MDPITAALTLYALAGLGALAHWLKRWARGQTREGLLAYLSGNFRHTLLSVGTALGAVTTMVAGGQALDGSPQSLALAFLAGYGADSALNKGAGD